VTRITSFPQSHRQAPVPPGAQPRYKESTSASGRGGLSHRYGEPVVRKKRHNAASRELSATLHSHRGACVACGWASQGPSSQGCQKPSWDAGALDPVQDAQARGSCIRVVPRHGGPPGRPWDGERRRHPEVLHPSRVAADRAAAQPREMEGDPRPGGGVRPARVPVADVAAPASRNGGQIQWPAKAGSAGSPRLRPLAPGSSNRYYRTQGRAWEEGSPRAGLPCVSSDRGTAQRVPWAQAAPIGQLRRGTETAPAGHTLWCSAAPLAPATRLEAACSCPEKEIGYRAARDPGSCDIIQRFAFCHGRAAAVGKFPSHC